MVIAEAISTRQTGDERAAFGAALSTDSRCGDCLSRDQTAGNLLPVLCAHRDGCHEDRRIGRRVTYAWEIMSRSYNAAKTRVKPYSRIIEELTEMRRATMELVKKAVGEKRRGCSLRHSRPYGMRCDFCRCRHCHFSVKFQPRFKLVQRSLANAE